MTQIQGNELSPAASRLAHARWNPAFRSSAEKRRAARALARRKWAKMTAAQRAKFCASIREVKEARHRDRLETLALLLRLRQALAQ